VGELGEDHKLDVEERLVADHGPVHHFQQSSDPAGDLVAVARARHVCLAGGGVIARNLGHGSPGADSLLGAES